MNLKRKIELSLLISFVITVVFGMSSFSAQCNDIRESVFRLHILANSNEDYDQQLKLKVRDEILNFSQTVLEPVSTKEEAIVQITPYLDDIKEVAKEVINENGYDYDVRVEISQEFFDTRFYEEVTLPAGQYQALRVLIGEGEGKNWWCVMFPQMCIPTATENQTEELSLVLNDEDLDFVNNYPKYEVKFKVVELYESFIDFLNNEIS